MSLWHNSLIICIVAVNCYDISFNQFVNSSPEKFGLMTNIQIGDGSFQNIKSFITRYSQMVCDQIAQLTVVWYIQAQLQQISNLQNQNWKKPVYFIKSPYNSVDFSYYLPQQSKAKVYFLIHQDTIITCQQLSQSFKIWKSKAVGNIGPLISYMPKSLDFNTRLQQFAEARTQKYYNYMGTDATWISSFFLNLYNSQQQWQINAIREIVKQTNNCNDIALNFIVGYYFPTLIPLSLYSNSINLAYQRSSIQNNKNNITYCLKKFTEILGYNPLRIIQNHQLNIQQKYKSDIQHYTIYLIYKQLSQRILQNREKMVSITDKQLDNWQKQIYDKFNENNDKGLTYAQMQMNQASTQQEKRSIAHQLQLIKNKCNYISYLVQNNQQQIMDFSLPKQNNTQSKQINLELGTKLQFLNDSFENISFIFLLIGLCIFFSMFMMIKKSQDLEEKEGQKIKKMIQVEQSLQNVGEYSSQSDDQSN